MPCFSAGHKCPPRFFILYSRIRGCPSNGTPPTPFVRTAQNALLRKRNRHAGFCLTQPFCYMQIFHLSEKIGHPRSDRFSCPFFSKKAHLSSSDFFEQSLFFFIEFFFSNRAKFLQFLKFFQRLECVFRLFFFRSGFHCVSDFILKTGKSR